MTKHYSRYDRKDRLLKRSWYLLKVFNERTRDLAIARCEYPEMVDRYYVRIQRTIKDIEKELKP